MGRLQLDAILRTLLGSDNVYFQAPASMAMEYPCITYRLDDESARHADNKPYKRHRRYLVTVIDRNPDSDIPAKVADLPMCTFDRFYPAENLNHFAYKLYFKE